MFPSLQRITIPAGAWMRFKSRGRYGYSRKTRPIVWRSTQPKGVKIYCVGWFSGQGPLMATHIINT